MTIAEEVDDYVQAFIEMGKEGITLFRRNLRQFIPDDELAELDAVFSWEGKNPLATLHFRGTTVTVRVAKWIYDDKGEITRVDEYNCIGPMTTDTVKFPRIRYTVLNAFGTEEARKREGEIVPIEGDEQQ